MSKDFVLGDFEDSDLPHVAELFDDYTDASDYFESVYFRVAGYLDKHGISITEYDEVVEALKVGQKALRLSGELETMNPTEKFLNDRAELGDRVRVLLRMKEYYDSYPWIIDLNPDKYDPLWGTGRGF